jgi:hypothetical protein
MGYHIKLDGWNPRDWKRTRNEKTNLTNPPPQIVTRQHRVGRLRLPNTEPNDNNRVVFLKRAKAIGDWLWVWIK